jgi:hypothetical protein
MLRRLKLELINETWPWTGVRDTSEFIAKKKFWMLLSRKVRMLGVSS